MGPEQVLIPRILKGDIEAFESLIRMYQGQLYSFIYKLSSSKEDTEEVLQDVFIKVYNNLFRYNSEFSFSTWIYRIAINTYKNSVIKKKSRLYTISVEDLEKELSSLTDIPESVFEIKEFCNEVIKLFDNLKDDEKIIFMLKYVKDFTYKEIGEITGISPESAKMKVYRSRGILVDRFKLLKKRGAV